MKVCRVVPIEHCLVWIEVGGRIISDQIIFCRPMKTKVRATVVCTRENRVLLVSKDGNRWALPGGRPNRDEPFIDAASREFLEETALVACKVRYLFQVVDATTVHHVFVAQVEETAEPTPGKEILHCQWFSHATLSKILISPTTRQIIKGYRDRFRG